MRMDISSNVYMEKGSALSTGRIAVRLLPAWLTRQSSRAELTCIFKRDSDFLMQAHKSINSILRWRQTNSTAALFTTHTQVKSVKLRLGDIGRRPRVPSDLGQGSSRRGR